MSDLQIGLIALGVLAVAGVVAYNKLQELRYKREAEAAFKAERPDVLLEPAPERDDDRRVEPRIEPVIVEPAIERHAEAPVEDLPAAEPEGEAPAAASSVDDRLDAVVTLSADEPVSSRSLWFAQQEALGAVARRLRWLVADAGGAWTQIDGQVAGTYAQIAAAVQLVDRNGPVTDAELDAFYAGMRQLADRFMAVVDLPDRFKLRARAHELDSFAASVDVQIGVNVVARRPEGFAGTKLRGLAEVAGLTLGSDGLFHALDQKGGTVFTLGNLEPALFRGEDMRNLTTRGITLILDVPRTRDGVDAFERMLATARKLASSLDGALVDDNRAPLTDPSLAFIRQKIGEFQAQMDAQGIPAGGDTACRLFA